MDIKWQLLNTLAVLDNKYLDKYITLITENKTTKKETFITQKHHIIPRYVFKNLNLPIDNSSYNIVNLKFSDHLLAHYYLMKCSSTPIYEFSNASAIIQLTGSPHSIGSEEWLKRNSNKLNEVYTKRIELFSLLHHDVQGNKNPRATKVFKYNLNGDLLFTFDTIKEAAIPTEIKQDSLRSMLSRNKFVLIIRGRKAEVWGSDGTPKRACRRYATIFQQNINILFCIVSCIFPKKNQPFFWKRYHF